MGTEDADPPVCPRCGESRSVRQLLAAFNAQLIMIESRRAAAAPPAAEDSPTNAGSGTGADLAQIEVGAVMAIAAEVAGMAFDAAVVKPAAAKWKRDVEPAMRDRHARILQSLREAFSRHPELYVCAKDDAVFVRDGKRFITTRDASRLLVRRDDARLAELSR